MKKIHLCVLTQLCELFLKLHTICFNISEAFRVRALRILKSEPEYLEGNARQVPIGTIFQLMRSERNGCGAPKLHCWKCGWRGDVGETNLVKVCGEYYDACPKCASIPQDRPKPAFVFDEKIPL